MWWKIYYTALKRNGWKQLFFYLSNLDVIRFIEFTKTIEFLNVKKSIILELGCGYSILPALLSDYSDYYICLDLSKNACKYQTTLPNVSSVVADMQHLPFKAEVIPIVLAISSIEHVPDDRSVFKEICRITKQDSEVIFCVPHSNRVEIKKIKHSVIMLNILYRFKKLWTKILGNHFNYFIEQTSTDSFMKYYTLEEINSMVESCGFKLKDYYFYEKNFLQKFFRILPKGWFVLKDIMAGWLLWKLEEKINLKDSHGIILKFKVKT